MLYQLSYPHWKQVKSKWRARACRESLVTGSISKYINAKLYVSLPLQYDDPNATVSSILDELKKLVRQGVTRKIPQVFLLMIYTSIMYLILKKKLFLEA